MIFGYVLFILNCRKIWKWYSSCSWRFLCNCSNTILKSCFNTLNRNKSVFRFVYIVCNVAYCNSLVVLLHVGIVFICYILYLYLVHLDFKREKWNISIFFYRSTMQLYVRGQSNHVIDCNGSETIAQVKVSILNYFTS